MATAGGSTAPAGEAPAMQARLATRAGLVAVATRRHHALVAVGDFGTVVRSERWGPDLAPRPRSVPVSGLLTAVSFADAQAQAGRWATAGVILATTDGGDTWTDPARGRRPAGAAGGAFQRRRTRLRGRRLWHSPRAPPTVASTWAADGGGRRGGMPTFTSTTSSRGAEGALFAAGESGAAFSLAAMGASTGQRLNTGVTGSLWSGPAAS